MCPSTTTLLSSDPSLCGAVEEVVRSLPGLRLQTLANREEARAWLEHNEVCLLLAHLPGGEGIDTVADLLHEGATAPWPIPTLVLADRHQPDHALALLRLGAVDYLSRPLDLNRLTWLVDTLTLRTRRRAEQAASPEDPPIVVAGGDDPFLYVRTGGMGLLMDQVRRVAPQETTVLLGGETGTGKTRLARLLHELSPRRDQPFRAVNCGSLAVNLIESEMFGHVRGAYTGADRDRAGKFEEVGAGTLLLDEIDSLPLTVQAKLLRVVEERVFEPVGSNKSVPMRARLITASNCRLEEEVAAGRFRADLLYRLDVVGFHIPPLRDRREVIRPLVRRLITEFAARHHCPVGGIAEAALKILEGHHWPGNIRELRNVIERSVALCAGSVIQPEDLPAGLHPALGEPNRMTHEAPAYPPPSTSARDSSLSEAREQAEASRIREVLKRNNNNRLRAAAELGISRMTLYKRLHRYGLMGTP